MRLVCPKNLGAVVANRAAQGACTLVPRVAIFRILEPTYAGVTRVV
jgi:hypothetical protein